MQWDTHLARAIQNSLIVSGGSAVLSTLLGLVVALCVVVLRTPCRRILSWSAISLILVPLYVQATAWSAGFGAQGWVRWNQVTAVLNSNYAVLACIWIHAAAGLPIAFLLLSVGLRRSLNDQTQISLLDRSAERTLLRFTVRKTYPWLVASLFFVFVWTNSDMVVTNLFQVPTVTEIFYQQVQFDKLSTWTTFVAILYSVVAGLCIGYVAYHAVERKIGFETESIALTGAFQSYKRLRWSMLFVALGIVVMFCLVPVLSLCIKAGWSVTLEGEHVRRFWNLKTFTQSMLGLSSFRDEIGWSVSIAIYATVFGLFASWALAWFFSSRWQVAIVFALLGFGLALPGPAINLFFHSLSNSGPEWIANLRDDSVVFVVLALQFRCLPIAYAIHWIAMQRFRQRYRDPMAMDDSSLWTHRLALVRPTVSACVISFCIAFANLETHLLILPPGVTTVAMRSFELLHYGVQNKEAGLSVCLVAFSIGASLLIHSIPFQGTTSRT